jgi:hypothetical protein
MAFQGRDRTALVKLQRCFTDEELVAAYLEHLEPLDMWQTRTANAGFVEGGAATLIQARRKAKARRAQEAQAVAEHAERQAREAKAEREARKAIQTQEAEAVEEVLGG